MAILGKKKKKKERAKLLLHSKNTATEKLLQGKIAKNVF